MYIYICKTYIYVYMGLCKDIYINTYIHVCIIYVPLLYRHTDICIYPHIFSCVCLRCPQF